MLEHSNSHNVASSTVPAEKDYFQTPFVPVIPFIGMAIDWYTIAQLEVVGLLLLALYLGTTVALYLMCCVWLPELRPERSHYHEISGQ